MKLFRLIAAVVLSSTCAVAASQSAPVERAPAVPLVAFDPYFSVWSMADKLTDENTKHWTGTSQPMRGLLRVDGKVLRWMGRDPRETPVMEQKSVKITPTHTAYTFEGAGVRLTATFLSPAIPQDLELMATPVTYVTWKVESTDGQRHAVQIYLGVEARIAVDTDDQQVTWQRTQVSGLRVVSVGSQEQRALMRAGDNLRTDWGYFHLAVPENIDATLAIHQDASKTFTQTGTVSGDDSMEMPSPAHRAPQMAVALNLDVTASQPIERHVLLSFTQPVVIEYLNRRLKPYWARDGKQVGTMLRDAETNYGAVEAKSAKFDTSLTADMERIGGPVYARVTTLAFRQTLAANGFAADVDGTPLQFPKENFSNGCIATVDVLYPSAPFFLFFNPALLEAQLKPVMEYASLPRWKWPFAPHDLGTYPLANGQVYGGGERTEEDQMPVEESGNMLLMIAAMGHAQGDMHFAKQYWPILTKWAEYLRAKGLDPENQLSTDDFAGHLAHNANLSIKAIDALGAYAEMARALGHNDVAREYTRVAKEMAVKWETMAKEGDHYKLAFDAANTWSQKYNLVWDRLLGLKLFPTRVRETELAFYTKHLNTYGLPLDNRRDYTKLDWEVWTATLSEGDAQFRTLIAPLDRWLNETPSRVPLTDWYDTKTGKQEGFQARSVVGGVYIKALSDEMLAKKWRTWQ
jgi:hypothetical protein